MKKVLYITAFAFFGLIIATLVHAGLEIVALKVIFENPATYADTFWWKEWHMIHAFVANLLWLVGFGLGIHYGIKYWEPYGSRPGFFCWKK